MELNIDLDTNIITNKQNTLNKNINSAWKSFFSRFKVTNLAGTQLQLI